MIERVRERESERKKEERERADDGEVNSAALDCMTFI